ncbi:MAG: VOC family protein [Selenomonas sp.]|uniref:VOC family protein n=1 Tax=Selenomonas sp. TaxID=2053611 RepID=UPI0025EDC1BB|nr:VOC family protein [Selenomonas sp.]MCR5758715.1 VOC family protein [Selenomonas sp.]
MSLLKGLHHAALRCCGKEEMERVITFYCDVLGMKRLRSWGEGTSAGSMLDTGNGVIELFADAEPGRKPGQVDHIALATDKVDECMAACVKEGLQVLMAPTDIVVPSEIPYPLRIAFVKGKAGEIIEFFDEK